MTKSALYQNLLNELNRSLIIKADEKTYWLENYTLLPLPAVEYFYQTIKDANLVVDRAIEAGLEADPQLIPTIELKLKNVKRTYLQAQEGEERQAEDIDSVLAQNLAKL